jgi:hypothetical protein
MTYTKEQLVDALVREYEFLCHDDFDPEIDMSISEYRVMMEEMSFGELVIETGTDKEFNLDEYMRCYGDN